MNTLALSLISSILLGLGATLTFDVWALFLKYAFKITPSNFCMVGRWILYMPEGTFTHSDIGSTPRKNAECEVGWIAHYIIGVIFASIFVAFGGENWLQHPTLFPATIFGVITVLAPFFLLQPSFGYGVAASKTSNPAQARLRSLINHTGFGIGLYLFGLLLNWFLWVYA
jgi:hypothetical protein